MSYDEELFPMHKCVIKIIITALCTGAVIFSETPGYSAHTPEPVVAIVGLPNPSPREVMLNGLFVARLSSVVSSTGIFSLVNPVQLHQELTGAGCVEESCLLRFARAASIDMVIRVTVEDRPGYSRVVLTCHGIHFPHNGRIVERREIMIPAVDGRLSLQDAGFIAEEVSGLFMARVLKKYRYPVVLKRNKEGTVSAAGRVRLDGEFEVWRRISSGNTEIPDVFRKTGSVRFINGLTGKEEARSVQEGDVVLYRFDEKARFLEDFYYGRKKEMVFDPPSWQDTLLTVLFTIPASASMPVMAPLGYYRYGDYGGLLLWAANAAPYLYVEIDGLLNRPTTMKQDHENITRSASAHYYFGLYMLCVGGVPLFVDAFSREYLVRASRYEGQQPLMGNAATAAYLSIISGGAGHFYRGHRFWGYLYFHLNNVLVYSAIKELCPSRRYNESTGRYVRGPVNRERAYTLLGVLGALKIVEVTHVILSKDAVRAGSYTPAVSSMEPVFYADEESGLIAGIAGVYRW